MFYDNVVPPTQDADAAYDSAGSAGLEVDCNGDESDGFEDAPGDKCGLEGLATICQGVSKTIAVNLKKFKK